MSNPGSTPQAKPSKTWVSALVVGLVVIGILAVGGALLVFSEAGSGPRPATTETKLKDHATGLTMTKRVARVKGAVVQISLTIGGPRSVEEPFALYQGETRSEFHWENGKLYACIEGQRSNDQGYWLDKVVLPDGGEVQIVKSCPGAGTTPPTAAAP